MIAPQILSNEPAALHFITGKQQVVGYDVASGTVTLRAKLPNVDLDGFNFVIRGTTLDGTDIRSRLGIGPANHHEWPGGRLRQKTNAS